MVTGINLYDIQKDFIKKAQNIIKESKIGIFSSPTGTGKTISLLLSILKFANGENDEDDNNKRVEKSNGLGNSISIENKILMEQLFGKDEKQPTIFYCSRTHSQLNQVIKELKRLAPNVKAVIVGSRKVYCSNKEANSLNVPELINEKCNDLVANGDCQSYNNTMGEIDCVSMKPINNKQMPSSICDVEDIFKFCSEKKLCPYFHVKNYAQKCDILFLPYTLLFSKEGRLSTNIDIKNSIIVVDEAHNIYDTMIQMNTIKIRKDVVDIYLDALGKYKSRYETRMLPINLLKFKNLIKILEHLKDFMLSYVTVKQNVVGKGKGSYSTPSSQEICINEKIMDVSDFLVKSELYNYNILEIDDYIRDSKLVQKLQGSGSNLQTQLFQITKFLKLLILSDEHGRIIYNKSYVKFTTLDPRIYFEEFMSCRSLILAGGTMEPVDDLMSIFKDRGVEYHTYNGVCTDFVSFILKEGPSRREMKLNFESKGDIDMIKEIIISISNLSNTVKTGGIICFLPSKKYISIFREAISNFEFSKRILFDDEHTFEDYSKSLDVESSILFAVMGGKLSEGINFADDLCRLLIVIGIPYPTLNLELLERTKHYGSNYSTLLAMKIVNQALGRALRHKKDYGAIVLMDSRYKGLSQYISPWVRNKTVVHDFPKTFMNIANFLRNR